MLHPVVVFTLAALAAAGVVVLTAETIRHFGPPWLARAIERYLP